MTVEERMAEIGQVERELEGLKQDEEQLISLREKYEQDFTEAESKWRAGREQPQLDAMVRAKGLLDTVKTALRDQVVEIAKVEAYMRTLRGELRIEQGISVAAEQASALDKVQQEFGSRLKALQEYVTAEAMALDALRVEWDTLNRDAWSGLSTLQVPQSDLQRRFARRGVDMRPLQLRLASSGRPINRAFEVSYKMPLHLEADGTAEGAVRVLFGTQVGTSLLQIEENRQERQYQAGRIEQARRRDQQRGGQ